MDKILLYDLETMANKAYVWGKYEQDVIAYIEEGYIISWSARWLGGKQITKALCDYPNYKPGDDKALVSDLHKLITEADVLVAHNGDRFDVKKMNTRFLFHKLNPPAPYKTVDTLKLAKKYFAFNSNKLDDLGNFLGVGRKVKHPGFPLWLGCEAGDPKSWELMKRYNRQDVILLEKIYLKLRPWGTHPPVTQDPNNCLVCKGTLYKRGLAFTRKGQAQRYQCTDCSHWTQGPRLKYEKSRQQILGGHNASQRSSNQTEIHKRPKGTRRTPLGKARDASKPGGRTDRWPDVLVYD